MRKKPFLIAFLMFLAALVAVPSDYGVALAFGERDDGVIRPSAPGRKSIFDIFRSGKKRRKRPGVLFFPDRKKKVRGGGESAPARIRSGGVSDDYGVRIETLKKDEDAKTVLVLGDFLGEMLARGLDEAFTDTPSLSVASSVHLDSGLADPGKKSWPILAREALEQHDAEFIVIMIGANDRKAIDEPKIEFREEGWQAVYKKRIEALLSILREAGKPIYLVGLPPVGDGDVSGDYVYFNDLYRVATFSVGGRFIDIWNNFLNTDGQYSRQGPDLEGTEKQLRWRDDIRFTRAGRRKLAYYVEREIRSDAGLGRGLAALPDAGGPLGKELYNGAWSERPTIGPVLSLTSPRLDYGAPLAGAEKEASSPPEDRPQYQLVVRGDVLSPQSGRADNFSWPPDAARPATGTAPAGEETGSEAADEQAAPSAAGDAGKADGDAGNASANNVEVPLQIPVTPAN